MKTFIALFRGINVGGSNRVSMAELKNLLQKNSCADVRTYIQSGNVLFRSAESDAKRLGKKLTSAIEESHGFAPRVLVLTRAELERAASGNPFPEADRNPQSLHLFFLDAAPKRPDTKALEALKVASERFALKGKVFYLLTPEGFGTSKLAVRAEKLLGVAATARNWRTVTTLIEMAKAEKGPGGA